MAAGAKGKKLARRVGKRSSDKKAKRVLEMAMEGPQLSADRPQPRHEQEHHDEKSSSGDRSRRRSKKIAVSFLTWSLRSHPACVCIPDHVTLTGFNRPALGNMGSERRSVVVTTR
jgi:hypothetical protein